MVPCNVGAGNISRAPCQSSDVQDDNEYPFEDGDLDDGLDPAMQEELDRYGYYLCCLPVNEIGRAHV